jgi:hypothetical protein
MKDQTMPKLTLKRSAEVYADVDLSEQDKYDLLDWLLGEMNGYEADAYGGICKYPKQISLIYSNSSTVGTSS